MYIYFLLQINVVRLYRAFLSGLWCVSEFISVGEFKYFVFINRGAGVDVICSLEVVQWFFSGILLSFQFCSPWIVS